VITRQGWRVHVAVTRIGLCIATMYVPCSCSLLPAILRRQYAVQSVGSLFEDPFTAVVLKGTSKSGYLVTISSKVSFASAIHFFRMYSP
jgi:hypothetical protein